MFLKRIDIKEKKPLISGKYLVETISTGPLKAKRRLETFITVTKGELSYGLSNQNVTHWFQEIDKSNSKKFLESKLVDLKDKFPNIKIILGFNNSINSFIVKILPLTQFDNNKILLHNWINIQIEFFENFNEELVFISSDSTLEINQIILDLS